VSVHRAAAEGFAAGAGIYVRGRPDYPPEAGTWLREVLGLGPASVVLDAGAGTGKFLPLLRETGARVLALEPVAEMRARIELEQSDVMVLAGTADAIPLPGAAVDAVTCAQAFHWFATAETLAEFRRVLRPGGVLGLVWNVRDERVPWVAELFRITAQAEGDTPRYGSGAWRRPFPAAGFAAIDERSAPNVHLGPADHVIINRTLSTSFVAALPAEKQAAMVEEIRALIAATPELTGASDVSFPYITRMYAFRRTA
jgi:SAM-dependent methyltransferase